MSTTATIQALGSIGTYTITNPLGIDDKGEITGIAGTLPSTVGFLWSPSGAHQLSPLAGQDITEGYSVNSQGEIVGLSGETSTTGGQGIVTAALWNSSSSIPINLGILPGDNGSIATHINDNGVVVGISLTSSTVYHGFIWQNGQLSQLSGLGGNQTEAIQINDAGQAVGFSATSDNVQHAVLWQNGQITELPNVGSNVVSSQATAINASGSVVGYSTYGTGPTMATLWASGKATQLATPFDATASVANEINDQGFIVGTMTYTGAAKIAVLWYDGIIVNLNTLLPANSGWFLSSATAINDQGQITGLGYLNNVQTAFELTLPTHMTVSAASATASLQDPYDFAVYGQVAVTDTAANVLANLSGLATLASEGHLGSITLTDSGTPLLQITAAQQTADAAVLKDISSGYALSVNNGGTITLSNSGTAQDTFLVPTANSTVIGAGYDILNLSQNPIASGSSAYTLTANADGSVNLATTGSSDHISGVLQIEFADKTVTVAANNSFGEYTALLYQGALGRTPDAPGLANWDALANALPSATRAMGVYGLSDASGNFNGSLSITAGFTNSAEFIAKYGSLNNTQFVTQLYTNVLDRAPDSGGLASWVTELNSGQSREHVLIGFAESAEAISNATNGFTGQSGAHAAWLFLV